MYRFGSVIGAVVALGFLLVACSPHAEQGEVPEGPENVTCVGSEEDLLAPLGEADGSTGWSVESWPPPGAPRDVPPDDEVFPSPEDFMAAVADSYAGAAEDDSMEGDEQFAVRLLCDPTGDEAQGAVLEWGSLDDSVAGADVRLTLAQEAAGWRVDEVERRSHCHRGQFGGQCL